MAGITDLPFRNLCRKLGASLAFSEMISSNPELKATKKSQNRTNIKNEPSPRAIQILGNDPKQMADTARHCVDNGADIIDINMGCPAKKVCSKATGSALLKDEPLIRDILSTVIDSIPNTPVTLKIRTGWSKVQKNALNVAKIAEESGIKALTIHGRTRECFFNGEAEYETIAAVKSESSIPIIANGDIDNPTKAKFVLEKTMADGLMIGRQAIGNPWIFSDIIAAISPDTSAQNHHLHDKCEVITNHIEQIHRFYGDHQGPKIARKHIQGYCQNQKGFNDFWKELIEIEDKNQQLRLLTSYLHSNVS
ncbi:MAG: tRNA dihydrouridine synthase DusB [Gammaproteobacteria bacterium]|nr:MAG: tRNA dihydrouridine synthase DusB [Gammaproteobacteria bacterium]